MSAVVAHRAMTFDPDVLDLYFSMKPAWRASGRMAHAAMKMLGPALMTLPDANSGLSAKHGFGTQSFLLFARASARRVGLMARPPRLANATWTHGSWSNLHELLRRDPLLVARLERLTENAALLDSGMFDAKGLERVVAEHLSGRTSHRKLLLELLTLSSWLAAHPYCDVVYDS